MLGPVIFMIDRKREVSDTLVEWRFGFGVPVAPAEPVMPIGRAVATVLSDCAMAFVAAVMNPS